MFDNSVGHLVAPRIALDALLCHSELLDGVDREPLEIACEVGARYAGDVPADRLRGADRIRHGLVGRLPPANSAPTIMGADDADVRPGRTASLSISAADADADSDDAENSEEADMTYGKTLEAVLVVAFVTAGCANTQSNPSTYITEQDLPSAVWKEKIENSPNLLQAFSLTNSNLAAATAQRNQEAHKAIEFVDSKFYKFYEKLVNQPDTVGGWEQAHRIFQWIGVTATAWLSWQAGQTDDPVRSASKNDNLTRVGLTTAAAAALWNVVQKIKSPEEDDSGVILKLEKNRRAVSDCILDALGSKSMHEYPVDQLLDDIDKYYNAGSPATSDSVYIWKLYCA